MPIAVAISPFLFDGVVAVSSHPVMLRGDTVTEVMVVTM